MSDYKKIKKIKKLLNFNKCSQCDLDSNLWENIDLKNNDKHTNIYTTFCSEKCIDQFIKKHKLIRKALFKELMDGYPFALSRIVT